MKKIALPLVSNVMLAPFDGGSASAAPVVAHHAIHRADPSVHHVRSHRGRHDHARHHARNRLRLGDPNARNPSLPGYARQRGSTSGGPRY